MRALIFELRPGNLEQDGLVRALKTHTSALQGRLGLPIVVESDLAERLPLAVEEALYRIAQEALHNVVKHAAAKQVWVGIRRHRRRGPAAGRGRRRGFDPRRVPDGHLGLAGHARPRRPARRPVLLHEPRPDEGTTIEVRSAPTTWPAARSPATARPCRSDAVPVDPRRMT